MSEKGPWRVGSRGLGTWDDKQKRMETRQNCIYIKRIRDVKTGMVGTLTLQSPNRERNRISDSTGLQRDLGSLIED